MEWVSSGTGDGYLNERVPWNNEYLFRREEVQGSLSTAQDLKKNGNGGRDVRNAVDVEERGVRLSNVKNDSYDRSVCSPIRRRMETLTEIGGTVAEFVRVLRGNRLIVQVN